MTIRGMQRVRQAGYSKDLRFFQLETLRIYGIRGMWIVFVQIRIRDLLTVSHLQLDGTWRVRNRFCNERREWESTEKYIYIYIYSSKQTKEDERAVQEGNFEYERLSTLQKRIEELDTMMNRDYSCRVWRVQMRKKIRMIQWQSQWVLYVLSLDDK